MIDAFRTQDDPGLLPPRPARLDVPAPARSWWRRVIDIWPHVMAGVMVAGAAMVIALAGFVL